MRNHQMMDLKQRKKQNPKEMRLFIPNLLGANSCEIWMSLTIFFVSLRYAPFAIPELKKRLVERLRESFLLIWVRKEWNSKYRWPYHWRWQDQSYVSHSVIDIFVGVYWEQRINKEIIPRVVTCQIQEMTLCQPNNLSNFRFWHFFSFSRSF